MKHEKPSQFWPSPCIIASVAGKIRIPNLTSEPRVLKKNEQFCQVRPITIASTTVNESKNNSVKVDSHNAPSTSSFHSANVRVDPESILDNTVRGSSNPYWRTMSLIQHSKSIMVMKDHSKPLSIWVLSNPHNARVAFYNIHEINLTNYNRNSMILKERGCLSSQKMLALWLSI